MNSKRLDYIKSLAIETILKESDIKIEDPIKDSLTEQEAKQRAKHLGVPSPRDVKMTPAEEDKMIINVSREELRKLKEQGVDLTTDPRAIKYQKAIEKALSPKIPTPFTVTEEGKPTSVPLTPEEMSGIQIQPSEQFKKQRELNIKDIVEQIKDKKLDLGSAATIISRKYNQKYDQVKEKLIKLLEKDIGETPETLEEMMSAGVPKAKVKTEEWPDVLELPGREPTQEEKLAAMANEVQPETLKTIEKIIKIYLHDINTKTYEQALRKLISIGLHIEVAKAKLSMAEKKYKIDEFIRSFNALPSSEGFDLYVEEITNLGYDSDVAINIMLSNIKEPEQVKYINIPNKEKGSIILEGFSQQLDVEELIEKRKTTTDPKLKLEIESRIANLIPMAISYNEAITKLEAIGLSAKEAGILLKSKKTEKRIEKLQRLHSKGFVPYQTIIKELEELGYSKEEAESLIKEKKTTEISYPSMPETELKNISEEMQFAPDLPLETKKDIKGIVTKYAPGEKRMVECPNGHLNSAFVIAEDIDGQTKEMPRLVCSECDEPIKGKISPWYQHSKSIRKKQSKSIYDRTAVRPEDMKKSGKPIDETLTDLATNITNRLNVKKDKDGKPVLDSEGNRIMLDKPRYLTTSQIAKLLEWTGETEQVINIINSENEKREGLEPLKPSVALPNEALSVWDTEKLKDVFKDRMEYVEKHLKPIKKVIFYSTKMINSEKKQKTLVDSMSNFNNELRSKTLRVPETNVLFNLFNSIKEQKETEGKKPKVSEYDLVVKLHRLKETKEKNLGPKQLGEKKELEKTFNDLYENWIKVVRHVSKESLKAKEQYETNKEKFLDARRDAELKLPGEFSEYLTEAPTEEDIEKLLGSAPEAKSAVDAANSQDIFEEGANDLEALLGPTTIEERKASRLERIISLAIASIK